MVQRSTTKHAAPTPHLLNHDKEIAAPAQQAPSKHCSAPARADAADLWYTLTPLGRLLPRTFYRTATVTWLIRTQYCVTEPTRKRIMRPLLCAAMAISVARSSSALTQMEWPMLSQSPPVPRTMLTWYKPCMLRHHMMQTSIPIPSHFLLNGVLQPTQSSW